MLFLLLVTAATLIVFGVVYPVVGVIVEKLLGNKKSIIEILKNL